MDYDVCVLFRKGSRGSPRRERLRAGFVPGEDLSAARIGLRGTAKIVASRVALGYYLLRRPLARLREWSGW